MTAFSDLYPTASVAKGMGVPWYVLCAKKASVYVITTILTLPVITYFVLSSKRRDFLELFHLVWNASLVPISELSNFKDETLLSAVWKDSPYREVAEYQLVEGFCGSATLKNVVASFGNVPQEKIPSQKYGAMFPKKFCDNLEALKLGAKSEIIRGDASFEDFRKALKKSNAENYRVVVNFLRPALFGFSGWRCLWFLPWNLMFGLFGGHFSPIVGYLEQHDVVAIFDLNAAYGFYLCPTRNLYEAVKAKDLMGGQPRALITIEIDK